MTLKNRVSKIERHLPENRHLGIEDLLRLSQLRRKNDLTVEEETLLQRSPLEHHLAEILEQQIARRRGAGQ